LEVLRLREEGWSIRAIAAEVFGEERYRGRVERILARRLEPLPSAAVSGAEGLEGLAPAVAIRELFERRLAMLLAGDVAPSMTELQKLLEVSLRLDAIARVEQVKELAQESRRVARTRAKETVS
jgi:hypothetical protein